MVRLTRYCKASSLAVLCPAFISCRLPLPRLIHASTGVHSYKVFDRQHKCLHRNWRAGLEDLHQYEYLHKEIAYRVADRIYDCKQFFDVAVDLGCLRGLVAPHVFQENVGFLTQIDMSSELLERASSSEEVLTERLNADEERAPLTPNSVDLVLSSLSLHWINDLPGVFGKVFDSLRPDGCFIGGMFAGDTLYELRCSLQLAELERKGGLSAHISPFTKADDIAGLLTRAGFNMLTIDSDEIVVNYPHFFALLHDLQGMGENSAGLNRTPLNRDLLTAASAIYQGMYANKEGHLPASFQIFYFIGWKPGTKSATPAERGSATVSLKDIQALTESSASSTRKS